MKHLRTIIGVLAVCLILAAACSSDDEASSTSSSVSSGTIPTVTVAWKFDDSVSDTDADQAASTMQRRLTKWYEIQGSSTEGINVTVNSGKTGLDITLPDIAENEANATVADLSFRGDLYFRPAIEGWPSSGTSTQGVSVSAAQSATTVPPATAETTAPATTATTAPADATTTTTGGDEGGGQPATPEGTGEVPSLTPTDQDKPDGTSVLPLRNFKNLDELRDPESAEIESIWKVGPSALSGSAIESAEPTTLNGSSAVKVVLKIGEDGLDAFNELAKSCYETEDSCASGAYGAALDANLIVVSIPRAGKSSFTPFTQEDVIIWSPDWTEEIAITLAIAFEAGTMPVSISQV